MLYKRIIEPVTVPEGHYHINDQHRQHKPDRQPVIPLHFPFGIPGTLFVLAESPQLHRVAHRLDAV